MPHRVELPTSWFQQWKSLGVSKMGSHPALVIYVYSFCSNQMEAMNPTFQTRFFETMSDINMFFSRYLRCFFFFFGHNKLLDKKSSKATPAGSKIVCWLKRSGTKRRSCRRARSSGPGLRLLNTWHWTRRLVEF